MAPASHTVQILMYHAVVDAPLPIPDTSFIHASTFQAHIEYLAARHDVVPLSRVPELLHDGVQRPTTAITLDDGFMNNYDVAFPLLQQVGLPATIFLCTDFIDSSDTIWFCRLHQAITETTLSAFEWHGERFGLTDEVARARASPELQARLKRDSCGDVPLRVAEVVRRVGGDWRRPVRGHSPYQMLSSAAVRLMAESPLIEFGAHTRDHTVLTHLPPARRREQIEVSIGRVEELTGRCCRLFAYPNGQAGDYDRDCIRLLTGAGIEVGVTAIAGLNGADTPPLELRRDGVWGDIRFDDFRALVERSIQDPVPGHAHDPAERTRQFIASDLALDGKRTPCIARGTSRPAPPSRWWRTRASASRRAC